MGLYLEDIAKVPANLTFKQCYQRIYNWHKQNGQKTLFSLRDPDEIYCQRYQQLMKLLPSTRRATKEDIAYIFQQVIMRFMEWSYHKEDEYGIKIAAYAHHGISKEYPKGLGDKQFDHDCQASMLYQQMGE